MATRASRIESCPSLVDLERLEDGPTLGVGFTARVLGLGKDTVRELIVAGDIRGFRVGRDHKVLWCSLRHYLFRIGAFPLRPAERKLFTSAGSGASPAGA